MYKMTGTVLGCSLSIPTGIVGQSGDPQIHWQTRDGKAIEFRLTYFGRNGGHFRLSLKNAFPADCLPDLHDDPKLWESFRQEMLGLIHGRQLHSAYLSAAIKQMMRNAHFGMTLYPRTQRVRFILSYPRVESHATHLIGECSVAELQPFYTFDGQFINWNADVHGELSNAA